MSNKKGRSLKSVLLTRRFHFRYMGLWILMTVCLLIAMNVMLFFFIDERWGGEGSLMEEYHSQYVSMRNHVVFAICAESLLFTIAIVFLAMLTAHRVAGPYIRLRHVCDEIANGNLDHKLKFRGYDSLDAVEDSFNNMMDKLREKLPPQPTDQE